MLVSLVLTLSLLAPAPHASSIDGEHSTRVLADVGELRARSVGWPGSAAEIRWEVSLDSARELARRSVRLLLVKPLGPRTGNGGAW